MALSVNLDEGSSHTSPVADLSWLGTTTLPTNDDRAASLLSM
jgi:hypothetical protein